MKVINKVTPSPHAFLEFVIKFLGDALLVVFQADPVCDDHQTDDSNNLPPMDSPTSEEPAAASRRSKVTVRKAVECGLELLARLSNYRIYLSEKEFSRKLSGPTVDDNGQTTGSGFGGNDDGSNGNLFPSNGNQSGNSNTQWNNSYTNAAVINGNGSIGANGFLGVPINRPNSNGNNNHNHNISNNGMTTRRSSVPTNNNASGMPNKFSSSNNLDITGGYRKREDSLMTPSRPGSTTSKHSRAVSFFSNAKNLFTHSSSQNDRQNITPDDLLEDSFELQLHMAMSAGSICKCTPVASLVRKVKLRNEQDHSCQRLSSSLYNSKHHYWRYWIGERT